MIKTEAEPLYLPKELNEQIQALEAITHYRELFNPAYCNNYSMVMLNKRIRYEDYKEETCRCMSRLNDACYALRNYFEACFADYLQRHPDMGDYETDLLKKMKLVSQNWNEKHENGTSYLAIDNLYFIVAGLTRLHYPFPSSLQTEPGIAVAAELLSL